MTIIHTDTPNQRYKEVIGRFPLESHSLISDISKHQGEVSMETMKRRGVHAIAIRVSIGNYYVDPMCKTYQQNALANDIHPTDYHVIRADNSVISQMDKYFLNRPSGDTPPSWPMILDDEVKGKSVTIWKNKNKKKYKIVYKKFSKAQITDTLLGCKELVEKRDGVTPIHYANLFFLFDNLEDVSPIWEMPLFIAQYGTLTPGRLVQRFQKRLDALNNGKGIQDLILIWQCMADSDDQGPYFGSGAHGLDIDLFMRGDNDAFDRYFNIDGAAPEPPPGPSDISFPLTLPTKGMDLRLMVEENREALNQLHRRAK